MKKLYLFIMNHVEWFIRIWFALLIPCVLSTHFARLMAHVNVILLLLLTWGNHRKWSKCI